MSKFTTYTCLFCNKTETDYLRKEQMGRGRKFCSSSCYWSFRRRKTQTHLQCATCGNAFERNAVHARRAKLHYCSIDCCKASRGRVKNERLYHDWLCTECGKRHCAGVLRCASCALKRQHRKLKNIVLDHYGRKCACCKDAHIEFLSIDHKNGGGAEHRREHFERTGQQLVGAVLYRWIIKNNFPSSLQVLCMNCNTAKSWHGKCPHENESNLSI